MAALTVIGGERMAGNAPWTLGNVVVCGTAGGQCTIYNGASASVTVSVPGNPKKDLGGVAWLSSFDLIVADAWNKEVVQFSRFGTHAGTELIDTSAHGTPGPLVVNSAGTIYVGLSDAGKILARAFDAIGTTPSVVADLSASGVAGIRGMDLEDNHVKMWITSGTTLYSFNVSGSANLQSFALGGPGGDVRIIKGSTELLVAVGSEIRQLSVADPGGTPLNTYDLTTAPNEAWGGPLALEPDGDHFLATTAAGAVYRFAFGDSDDPIPPTELVVSTGSTTVTSLTEKGGPQLNIRPIRFKNANMLAETNVHREATFGVPGAPKGSAFAPHQFGLLVPTLESGEDFIAVVSATWVKGNGVCEAGDYDCRLTDEFGPGPLVPRCIPYVTDNDQTCVFYRLEDESVAWQFNDGMRLDLLTRSIDYLSPASFASNPRILRDPPDLANSPQFTEDITIGLTKTAASDPLLGEGRGGSDYGAFDREPQANPTSAAAIATILKPTPFSVHQTGRSVPFDVRILLDGKPFTDALSGANSMSLTIEHLDTGTLFLHPQPTPGGSPEFFIQIKAGTYRGIVDLTGKPLGNYVGCVVSTDDNAANGGQFDPVCVEFSVKAPK